MGSAASSAARAAGSRGSSGGKPVSGIRLGGNGLPLNAKPAGQYEPSIGRWLILGNTASYFALREGASDFEELPPIPVEWIIAPNSNSSVSAGQCPSMGETINSFVISDVVSGVITVFICCRPILKKITGGVFGKLPDKNSRCCSSMWYSWLVGFSMTFLGNLFASLVVVNTEGYEHLSFAIIFALYASRPRMNLVVVALFRVFVTKRTSDWSNYKPVEKGKAKEQMTEPYSSLLTTADGPGDGSSCEKQAAKTDDIAEPLEKEYVYLDSYRSTLVAEILLHIISGIFTGITWERFPNYIIKDRMQGLVVLMTIAPVFLVGTALFTIPLYWRRDRRLAAKWTRAKIGIDLFLTAYVSSWIYWCLFLRLPGSL
ncbi:hypothetical protein CcaCcLH18_09526 [Colletotrichum camelliae]|nr:hypothetical protein CcaCcLH18_09526 [Colletotrichum camelliae]